MRLFVGGLPKDIKEGELVSRFGRFGDVSNIDISINTQSLPNEPRGKGFAHFDLSDNVDKCIACYNKAKWSGGVMRVERSNERYRPVTRRVIPQVHEDEVKVDINSELFFKPEIHQTEFEQDSFAFPPFLIDCENIPSQSLRINTSSKMRKVDLKHAANPKKEGPKKDIWKTPIRFNPHVK